MNSKLIEIGRVFKPHSIKGAFSLQLHNQQETFLKKGMEINIFPLRPSSQLNEKGEIFKIASLSIGNKAILSLVGVENRNHAEEILPFSIQVSRDLFPQVNEDEFYLVDLIGLKVIDYNSKKELGKIKDFYDHGAGTILEIRGEISIDLPFVDNFFPEIDFESKQIYVLLPEKE
jgi:16S rRNA processing protein RimM